jgi:predicted XRE-type DNA-binding protein
MKKNFPSDKTLQDVRKKLNKSIASRPLPAGALPTDVLKHRICEVLVRYKADHPGLTQVELSKMLFIHESLVSKILHYHTDEFTVDRLIGILSRLFHDVIIEIKPGQARVA